MIKEAEKRNKRLLAGLTLLSLEIIISLIAFAGALVLFIIIAQMVFLNNKSRFDVRAFSFLARFVSDINTDIMQFFSFLGSHTFLIPANILLISYFLLLKKHKWYSISIPVVSISSLLLMSLLKYIFHRDRPITPLLRAARGYSFPSGHALVSFTFYGLLIYLVWLNIENARLKWLLTICLALLVFAIGLSRVYLRVHYASDVIAGYCLGCMWLLLSLRLLKNLETFSRRKIDTAIDKSPDPAGQ